MNFYSVIVVFFLILFNISCVEKPNIVIEEKASAVIINKDVVVKKENIYELQEYIEPANDLTFIKILAGCFKMGSLETEKHRDKDEAQHNVCIEKDFYISTTEVTFAAYDRYAKEKAIDLPGDNNWGRGMQPVIFVSWYDAIHYAKWLSEKTGYHYRLPTEAEWEYAARAGTGTAFWWGDTLDNNTMNCNEDCKDSYWYTAPVNQFKANPWGLYQVHGNVWEWTCSVYAAKYNGAENLCIEADKITADQNIVLRGGAWNTKSHFARSATRGWTESFNQNDSIGFRLVRE